MNANTNTHTDVEELKWKSFIIWMYQNINYIIFGLVGAFWLKGNDQNWGDDAILAIKSILIIQIILMILVNFVYLLKVLWSLNWECFNTMNWIFVEIWYIFTLGSGFYFFYFKSNNCQTVSPYLYKSLLVIVWYCYSILGLFIISLIIAGWFILWDILNRRIDISIKSRN